MLRLKTFGGLSILRDTSPAAGAGAQRRRLALLALLDGAGARGLTRDKLLGDDDLFLGANEVRLNPAAMSSDRTEFEAAIEAGQLETAAALYEGPFLDGFYIPGAAGGDRSAALQHYRAYESLLRADLDLEPDAAVKACADALRYPNDAVATPPPPPPGYEPPQGRTVVAHGRDRRLHHHIRGLPLSARSDLPGADREFRQAVFSAVNGTLGPTWRRDSATACYERVTRAWQHADSAFGVRRQRIDDRLSVLKASRQ